MYACFKIVPARFVVGNKITASWKTQTEAADKYIVVMGYANGVDDFKKITETSLGSTLTMTVEESYANLYKYVVVWLYANRVVPLSKGEYVDYTDVQVEIGDAATEYEAYDGVPKSVTITAVNGRKAAIPTVMTTTGVTIEKDGFAVSVQAGTEYRIPELELKEGENLFTVTGTGLCLVKYQEGGL